MKSILPILLAIGLIAPAGCGSEVDPVSVQRTDLGISYAEQEAPGSRPTSRPQEVTGLPRLTGDRERDVKAVAAALKRTKAQWQEASNAWHSAIEEGKKKAEPALVSKLEQKTKTLSSRARKLQQMLDEIRNPSQGRAADVLPALKLTGDRKRDAATIAKALRATRDEWKKVNTEYMAILATEKNPPKSKVEKLQQRSAKLKQQAAALQAKLDGIRRGS